MLRGRPTCFKDEAELWNKFIDYLEYCDNFAKENATSSGKVVRTINRRIPTIGMFLVNCGVSIDWITEHKDDPNFSETIKQIIKIILARKKDALLNDEGSTTGIIFDLKCNENWIDKTIIDHQSMGEKINVTFNLGGKGD